MAPTPAESAYWELEDSEALESEAPSAYSLPDRSVRESLPPGTLVKLVFRILTHEESGAAREFQERMWVRVEGSKGDRYLGTLDDASLCTESLGVGFELEFGAEHVLSLWDEASEDSDSESNPIDAA